MLDLDFALPWTWRRFVLNLEKNKRDLGTQGVMSFKYSHNSYLIGARGILRVKIASERK